jgi:dihydroorotase
MNRREFLASSLVLAAVRVPFPTATKYDLVIKGGRVLDASQKIDRILDVAIRQGKITALQPDIPATDAGEVFDAQGRIVTPGLVDIHSHVRPAELSAEQVLSGGVTTVVDAGSRGSDGILDMIAVSNSAPNRLRALINVSRLGNQGDGSC